MVRFLVALFALVAFLVVMLACAYTAITFQTNLALVAACFALMLCAPFATGKTIDFILLD